MKRQIAIASLVIPWVLTFSAVNTGTSRSLPSHSPPSAASAASSTAASQVSEFETIRAAAQTYAESGKAGEITAKELYGNMTDGKEGNDPLVLCVYDASSELPDVYSKGHIPGAVKMPWSQLMREKEFLVLRGGYSRESYMARLPKDRQIVVYSYNGHVGDQVTTLLNMLGYDAVNLKWGMTSWTRDKDAAPGRYDESKDCTAQRIDTTINEQTERYTLPAVKNTSSEDQHEIIRAAAEAYARSGKAANISADDLFNRQRDRNPANRPVVLCVDEADTYANGHILGAINIPYKVLFAKDNLRKLDSSKQIVIYSYNGHTGSQATAMLNMLGYDAVNMRWGLTAWTFRKDVAPGRYDESKDCFDYVIATGPLPLGEQGYY